MKPFWVFIAMLTMFCFCGMSNANTVGLSYDRAVNDSNFGVYGDYEVDIEDNLNLEIDGQYQFGDDHTGNIDAAITAFDNFRIETNNYFINEGRKLDVGASFVVNIQDAEVSVGIFGVNGNPFDPVETATKVDGEWVADDPVEPPIRVKQGSTLNAALKTEFNKDALGRTFEVGLRGLLELTDLGDIAQGDITGKLHQFEASISTGGDFAMGADWTLRARLAAQAFDTEEGFGTAFQLRSVILGLEYPF